MLDPIKDIARGNCVCGKWLVIPKSYTRNKPRICSGPCHSGKECGRVYYWDKGAVVSEQRGHNWINKTKHDW